MIIWTLDVLMDLLTRVAWQPGRKEFHCAGDVVAALGDAIPDAVPVPPGKPSLALLMGVDIICELSYEPGCFRLIRHDGCYADIGAGTVDHGRCPVTADGIVQLAVATPEETADAAGA